MSVFFVRRLFADDKNDGDGGYSVYSLLAAVQHSLGKNASIPFKINRFNVLIPQSSNDT